MIHKDIQSFPKQILRSLNRCSTREGEIEYLLKRSISRRTLTILIDHRATVSIYAPHLASLSHIEKFIREKAEWIFKKLKEVKAKSQKLSQQKFEDGQEFLFLGKKYRLLVEAQDHQRGRITFDGQHWRVALSNSSSSEERAGKIREHLIEWYRREAEEFLGGRVLYYARILKVEPQKIVVRTQKRLWGSCHHQTRAIHLNWQIILSPPEVIDYVIVHELCHLIVPNHSQRFWKKVSAIMPNFNEYRKWLCVHALEMTSIT